MSKLSQLYNSFGQRTKVRNGVRATLIQRDGMACWLCGGEMVLTSSRKAPAKVTVDHVLPVIKGGTATIANLRLAHNYCNSLRGCGPGPVDGQFLFPRDPWSSAPEIRPPRFGDKTGLRCSFCGDVARTFIRTMMCCTSCKAKEQ